MCENRTGVRLTLAVIATETGHTKEKNITITDNPREKGIVAGTEITAIFKNWKTKVRIETQKLLVGGSECSTLIKARLTTVPSIFAFIPLVYGASHTGLIGKHEVLHAGS